MKDGPPVEEVLERTYLKSTSDNDRLIYSRVHMPFMSDRDYVMQYTKTENTDGSVLLCMRSLDSEEVPPVENVVRMRMFQSQLIKQDPANPDDLLFTDFSSYDV